MRLLDSRRLRGPNLQTMAPCAVAEVTLERGERRAEAAAAWRREASRMRKALGWADADALRVREFRGGLVFALPAPVDVLYLATEVNEWAIARASDHLAGRKGGRSFDEARDRFAAKAREEKNPRLVALRAAASAEGAPFIWDDDRVTLGMAGRSVTFELMALPEPREVEWSALGRIPVVLVTGTNGKTTTARLLSRMGKVAGKVVGSTSTDGVYVDGKLVLEGDYTGAEGARLVLRRPEVELAVLETARGGILRRGLSIDACDAAVITNVSADHVGEFGVNDLATMVAAKAVIGRIVRPGGRVVLNADDARLARLARSFPAPAVLFSMKPRGKAVLDHLKRGGEVFTVEDGVLVRKSRKLAAPLLRVDEAPITFGGAAPYNVANALAAAAAAHAIGLSSDAITGALRAFGASPDDNPGRGHVVRLPRGPTVLLDFGHNPAGLVGLYALARSLCGPRGRLLAVHTQPGDRTPEDTRGLASAIVRGRPHRVVAWESPDYRRGREPGDITLALRSALIRAGQKPRSVGTAPDELAAVRHLLELARAGDVVVVAPHIEREAIAGLLEERAPASGAERSDEPVDLAERVTAH